jgi:SAM-dependent methyltransferase
MKSDRSMFSAAIESARIFNHVVREVADTSGLLAALDQPRSVDDVVQVMRFSPRRAEQVRHMLRTLAAEGVVAQREHQGITVFQTNGAVRGRWAATDNGRYRERTDQIAAWFGEQHVEKIRRSNKDLLGPKLDFLRSPDAAIQFNRRFEAGWRTNLLNPLYEYGRVRCVDHLVTAGTRFLDLACGPGFGAIRLAELSLEPCRIVAMDKSRDFLELARRNTYPDAVVEFVERDLNTGLPPLAAESMDGVLFNGAFHFMADKAGLLRQIWRVLRPGGLLAIGHCFSSSGFADETMHDFYFSMLDDRTYVLPWVHIKELVREAGFDLRDEFHRGSHSYLLAERLADPPPPTAMGSLVAQTRGGQP